MQLFLSWASDQTVQTFAVDGTYLDVNLKLYNTTICRYNYVTAFSKGWLRRKLWVLVCLECREENRPFSGQQHQARFGHNPALFISM